MSKVQVHKIGQVFHALPLTAAKVQLPQNKVTRYQKTECGTTRMLLRDIMGHIANTMMTTKISHHLHQTLPCPLVQNIELAQVEKILYKLLKCNPGNLGCCDLVCLAVNSAFEIK
ncbi:hypothetical protein AMECASPLE_038826 [Ameca splendens]|uniref:Uncharacterized protein n=1 Tax=Ameca splendens TaxID=208324 RepID=A0ABV1AEP3_9TELE